MNSATWIALGVKGIKALWTHLKNPKTYWKIRKREEERKRKEEEHEKACLDFANGD